MEDPLLGSVGLGDVDDVILESPVDVYARRREPVQGYSSGALHQGNAHNRRG